MTAYLRLIMRITDSFCFPLVGSALLAWTGVWTDTLTIEEMNQIDCEPGDADIPYDAFELVGLLTPIPCEIFEEL